MPITSRFNLPTSVPARQVLPTVINKATANLNVNTPVVSVNFNNSFDPINTSINNNKFVQSLNRLNEPITRLQDLGANTSNMVRSTIESLIPVNPLQNALVSNITNKFNAASIATSNALSLPVVATLSPTITSGITSIPRVLNPLQNSVQNVLNTGGLNLGNSTIGLAAGGLLLCGVLSSLMKIDISSLTSQLLQMQRTALAKLDKAISEIISVIKKPIDKLLALIPKVEIPIDIDNYTKLIEEKYKSIVAQISKFTSKLDDILKNASDCLQGLNTILGMVGLIGGLFGLGSKSVGNNSGSGVLNCSNVKKLVSFNNLGNISNVQYEIGKIYPELVNDSMYSQTNTNREVANKDLDFSRDQYDEELNKQREEINNQVAQDIEDPSFDILVEDFISHAEEEINNLINYVQSIIEEVTRRMGLDPSDPEYLNTGEGKQALDTLYRLEEALRALLEAIQELSQLPDSNREVISQNAEKMLELINELNDEINKTLDEQQQNLDDIYDELETNAELIDKETITEEPVDTSCKT